METLRARLAVGTMTGTSIDGIDVAIVRLVGRGLGIAATIESHAARPFPPDLAEELRAAAEGRPMRAGAFARLARRFGEFHAEVMAAAIGDRRIDFAAVHGQTLFHAPPDSWQLVNAAPIVARLGCPVVTDLRQADLADGGEGAPITPLADWVLFRGDQTRAIVNLGGFCNATILPAGAAPHAVRGRDVCACNQLLDAIARRALGRPYDADGAAAAAGRADVAGRADLVERLRRQGASRRSLGTGDEATEWIERWVTRLAPGDLAATATDAIAGSIAAGLREDRVGEGDLVLVAGGGARHQPLVSGIARHLGCAVRPIDALGVPIDAREAAAMAVLGGLADDGVRIGLPAITGRSDDRVADGCWWRPAKALADVDPQGRGGGR